MTSKNQAACQFCSKPDDSIQVVCESRCLLCSKCQLVPAIRKLLIDHTLFSDDPSALQAFYENPSSETKLIEPERPGTSNGNVTNAVSSNVALALKGSCPICSAPMSASMLLMIQSYREALKSSNDEQAAGVRLEEFSQLIPQFLRRFMTVYDTGNDNKLQLATATNNTVDIDAEIDNYLNNPKINQPTAGNIDKANLNGKGNNKAPVVAVVSEKESIPAAARVNITVALEFVIDCYHAQWQSIVKNANDSMLTTMMKQCNRKKFSQKTNDYKTKHLFDFFHQSNYGYEMPELILFCHLIGLQPKFSMKISPAWSQLTAIALVAICNETCLKQQELFMESTTTPLGISELKPKMMKCFHMVSLTNNNANNPATNQLNSNNPKVITVKKALKVLQFFQTIRQPYWIMAPVIATCVEYESRLAWTEDSIAKLISMIFFIALMETQLLKKGVNLFTTGESSSNSNNNKADGNGNNSNPNANNNSIHRNNSNPTPSDTFITTDGIAAANNNNTSIAAVGTPQKLPNVRSMPAMSPAHKSSNRSLPISRRLSASTISKSATISMSGDSDQSHQTTYKPITSRADLMRRLHPMIDQLWKDCSERFGSLQDLAATRRDSFKQLTALPLKRGPARRLSKEGANSNATKQRWNVLLDYWNELDDHLLHRKEKSYFPLTLDEALTIADTIPNLMLPINDFLYAMVLCWQREYELVLYYLEKAKLTKLRRPAIAANYLHLSQQYQADKDDTTASNTDNNKSFLPPMTAGEKQAIMKLLYYYRHPETKEFLGIDWDDVEQHQYDSYYPFTIPRSLLKKSRVELNLLGQYLIGVVQERMLKEETEAILLQNENNRILLNYRDHEVARSKLTSTRQVMAWQAGKDHPHSHHPIEEEDNETNYGEDSSYRLAEDSVSTFDTINTPPILAVMKGERKVETNGVSYSEALLQNSLEEVNKQYIPNYDPEMVRQAMERNRMKTLARHTAGGVGGGSRSLQTSSSLPILSNRPFQSSRPTSPYRDNSDDDNDPRNYTVGGMQRQALSPKRGDLPLNSLPNVQWNAINGSVVPSKDRSTLVDTIRTSAMEGKKWAAKKNEDSLTPPFSPSLQGGGRVPSPQAIVNQITSDTSYFENIDSYRKNRILSTRKRILDRSQQQASNNPQQNMIDVKTTFDIVSTTKTNQNDPHHHSNNNQPEESTTTTNKETTVLESYTIPTAKLSWKSRIIPYLYLTPTLNSQGDLVVNFSNSLIAESSVRFLSMKNGQCSLRALQIMLSTYCKPWQLEYMKILHLGNNPRLGSSGAELLGRALSKTCRLIHLNINNCLVGDAGLRAICQGIITGGGSEELLRFDLQENHVTIATDAFRLLQHFTSLKQLDISRNLFTLDKEEQWQHFREGIYPLLHHHLEYFSIAYNKIQDKGFIRIVEELLFDQECIFYHFPLKVFDISYCFLTNKSKYHLELLIVNSLHRENDGAIYKKAYEYTENHFMPHQMDFQGLDQEIQLQLEEQQRQQQLSNRNKKGQKRKKPPAAHRRTVLAVLPNTVVPQKSKYTEQKIAKVMIRPEMIPIIANISRSHRSDTTSGDSSMNRKEKERRSSFLVNTLNMLAGSTRGSFTFSSDSFEDLSSSFTPALALQGNSRASFLTSTRTKSSHAITEAATLTQAPDTPSAARQQRSKRQRNQSRSSFKRKYNIRDSFFHHLNSIVHQNENIIFFLNHLENPPSFEDYHSFQLTSYYILTGLQMILLYGNIITQNVWDEILDFQEKVMLKVCYHPNHQNLSIRRHRRNTDFLSKGLNVTDAIREEDEDEEEDAEDGNEEEEVVEHTLEEFNCYELGAYDIEIHESELATL